MYYLCSMCEIKINEEYKVCRKCNETLSIDCFKENPKLKSGYNGSCRSCSNMYVKKDKSKVVDGYKVCSKCDKLLPVNKFRENLTVKSGLHSSCHSCSNTYVKKLPPSDVVDGHKMCLKCNELLPVNKFRENLTVKSGLHSYCIDCTTILKKVREPKVVIPKKVREPKVVIPKKVREPKVVIPKKVKEPKVIIPKVKKVKEPKVIIPKVKKVREPKVVIPKKVKPPRIVDGKCVCSICKELLPVDNFYVDKKKKEGIMYLCKVCKLSQNKKSRELHKYNYSEYRRQYKKERAIKDRIIREQEKLIKKQEREKELELLKIQKENIRLENLENKRLEKIRITEENRLERIRVKEEYLQSEEYQEHQRLLKDRQRLSVMRKFNRRMEEPLFKFKKLLRNNIRNSFKRGGFSKTSQACEILGADWDVVKKYFESKFKPGMTWENMGLWHIDHIFPISMATCEEDVIRLNHYTNLQPLWAEDNIKKSDKLTTEGYFKQKFPYNEITSDDEVNLVEVKIDDNRGLGFFW